MTEQEFIEAFGTKETQTIQKLFKFWEVAKTRLETCICTDCKFKDVCSQFPNDNGRSDYFITSCNLWESEENDDA